MHSQATNGEAALVPRYIIRTRRLARNPFHTHAHTHINTHINSHTQIDRKMCSLLKGCGGWYYYCPPPSPFFFYFFLFLFLRFFFYLFMFFYFLLFLFLFLLFFLHPFPLHSFTLPLVNLSLLSSPRYSPLSYLLFFPLTFAFFRSTTTCLSLGPRCSRQIRPLMI